MKPGGCIDGAAIETNLANVAQALFRGAHVVAMTWAPSAETLMKSVPLLGRQRKSLLSLAENPGFDAPVERPSEAGPAVPPRDALVGSIVRTAS